MSHQGIPLPNSENYFSSHCESYFFGSTSYKRFNSCPAAALAISQGRWVEPTSTAMTIGSYIDASFSGTLDIFRAQHPEILKRDGSLLAVYEQANGIIARIERDPLMMRHLSGEMQRIMTGEIAGVPFKIRIDSYFPGEMIVDLKIMRDMKEIWKDGARKSFVEAWGYDVQMCIYSEIVRQNTGVSLPVVLAVATKEPEPDIALIGISRDRLDACLEEVIEMAPQFQAIKMGLAEVERCQKCDYCKSTKVLTGVVDYLEVGE
jgi:hypothetical protein